MQILEIPAQPAKCNAFSNARKPPKTVVLPVLMLAQQFYVKCNWSFQYLLIDHSPKMF